MEKDLIKKKAQKEETIRILDNEIQAATAEISKHGDELVSFNRYKQFMMDLAPEEKRVSIEIE